jgi:hypothetical protein
MRRSAWHAEWLSWENLRGHKLGNACCLMGPEILHRVQFRSIGGKKLQPDASLLLPHQIPHRPAAVGRQAIPDNQQLARNMAQQMREKLDDLRAAV